MDYREPDVLVVLPGPPRGKGRPRMSVAAGFARAYTDAKTRNYEGMLRDVAQNVMGSAPLLTGPLRVVVHALFPVPASWSRKKRADALAGVLRPTGKPDGDNLAKSSLDPLNGIVFQDDAQVVDLRVVKLYAEKPLLEIGVWLMT